MTSKTPLSPTPAPSESPEPSPTKFHESWSAIQTHVARDSPIRTRKRKTMGTSDGIQLPPPLQIPESPDIIILDDDEEVSDLPPRKYRRKDPQAERHPNEFAFLMTDLTVDDPNGALKVQWRGEMFSFDELLGANHGRDLDAPLGGSGESTGENWIMENVGSELSPSVPRKPRVMIYWDVENVSPVGFHLPAKLFVRTVLGFGKKFGDVIGFKAFCNESQRVWMDDLPSQALEIIHIPYSFKNSERTDDAIIVDMSLQTAHFGPMQPGDTFVLVTMDADYAVINSALKDLGYKVMVLAFGHCHAKEEFFDSSTEFFTIGDEGVFKIPTRESYMRLLRMNQHRKRVEPKWKSKLRSTHSSPVDTRDQRMTLWGLLRSDHKRRMSHRERKGFNRMRKKASTNTNNKSLPVHGLTAISENEIVDLTGND